jgi:hypothetical protein
MRDSEDLRHKTMKALLKMVIRGTLFVRPSVSGQSLSSFATQMFTWLGMQQFEEDVTGRDGEYLMFVGSAVGITVVIEENVMNSRKVLEKYPFKISLAAQGTRQAADYLIQHAHILAWRLSHEGYRCFVPKNPLLVHGEQDGMVYDA